MQDRAITYLFGIYAVAAGISEIGLGIRLHGLDQSLASRTQGVPSSAA